MSSPYASSPHDSPHGPDARFGAKITTHAIVQDWRDGAWGDPRIERAHRIDFAPQARVLHYAQSVFEGFKAHRMPDGSVALFRPQAHLARFARSCARMALPGPDESALLDGIRELVHRDAAAVPPPPAALYVRPFVFATDEDLIAGPSATARLLVLLAPVPAFFGDTEGLRLRTETEYVRAFPGGTGAVKSAGNYAASMLAQQIARAEGFHEVVWLDAIERRHVEETGAMNLFLVRGDELVTAPAGDTVLPGITRDSLLQLARDAGMTTRETSVAVDDGEWPRIREVFSSGTAVGCVPIASIEHEGRPLFRAGASAVQQRLARALLDLKEGRAEDPYDWRVLC